MHEQSASERHAFRTESFQTVVAGRVVPGICWIPESLTKRPLVLVGHGGSGHKNSQLVRDVARPLVQGHGFVVAAIDGPVHGDRRASFADGPSVRDEFRELWAGGESIEPMLSDWRATLDALCSRPIVDASAIGWYGISMGTAYGLPFVAMEPRIRAAVLGMWGTCRIASERLANDAPGISVPVLFQRKADDPLFTVEGQEDIFNRLGSTRKRMAVYPGGHTDPADEQLRDIVAFLVDELGRSAER